MHSTKSLEMRSLKILFFPNPRNRLEEFSQRRTTMCRLADSTRFRRKSSHSIDPLCLAACLTAYLPACLTDWLVVATTPGAPTRLVLIWCTTSLVYSASSVGPFVRFVEANVREPVTPLQHPSLVNFATHIAKFVCL